MRFFAPLTIAILFLPAPLTPTFANFSQPHQPPQAYDFDELIASCTEFAEQMQCNTMAWRRTTESSYPIDELLAKIGWPAHERSILSPLNLEMSWSRDKFFYKVSRFHVLLDKNARFDSLVKMDIEMAFDGSKFYVASGKKDQDKLAMLTIHNFSEFVQKNPNQKLLEEEFYHNIGLSIPSQPKTWPGTVRPLLSELLDAGATITKVETLTDNGRDCLICVLEDVDWRHEMLFRKDLGYALARHLEIDLNSDKTSRVVENQDFQRIAGTNVWLPQKTTVYNHQWRRHGPCYQRPLTIDHFVNLTATTTSVPNHRFSIRPTVGTLVFDETHPQAKFSANAKFRYYQPAGVDELEAVVARIPNELATSPKNRTKNQISWLELGTIALAAFCSGAVGWLAHRHRYLPTKR